MHLWNDHSFERFNHLTDYQFKKHYGPYRDEKSQQSNINNLKLYCTVGFDKYKDDDSALELLMHFRKDSNSTSKGPYK